MLWDLNEGKHLYTLDGGDIINALCFSPNRYWLCAATGPSIKIWVWDIPISPQRITFLILWVWRQVCGQNPRPAPQISWCRALLVTWDGSPWWHCPHPLRWEGGVGHSHCSAVMKLRCHLTASLCGNPEAVSEHPTACSELE